MKDLRNLTQVLIVTHAFNKSLQTEAVAPQSIHSSQCQPRSSKIPADHCSTEREGLALCHDLSNGLTARSVDAVYIFQ